MRDSDNENKQNEKLTNNNNLLNALLIEFAFFDAIKFHALDRQDFHVSDDAPWDPYLRFLPLDLEGLAALRDRPDQCFPLAR